MTAAEAPQVCSVCGRPATHFIAVARERADGADEPLGDHSAETIGRYFCDQHRPRLHLEPLEERID
jgi:hypothetical protein